MTFSERKRRRQDAYLEALEQAEDHRLEIENRIRNLFWTVSGDYSLQIKPDVNTFVRSESLALYDAIKQGAFASHFDMRSLSLYVMKKRMRGADEDLLMELTQLCMDAAVFPLVSAERQGVAEIRRRAFQDVLGFQRFRGVLGKIRKCIICRFLNEDVSGLEDVAAYVDAIEDLGVGADTDAVIRVIDALYNQLVDPGFEKTGGDLESVLSITIQELVGHQNDYTMSDDMMQRVLDEYLDGLQDELMATLRLEPTKQHIRASEEVEDEDFEFVEPDPEDVEKVHDIIVKQFGEGSLSRGDQERMNRRLCTGIHKRCSLHLTAGLLVNPAVKSTQYLRTQMASEKNELYFKMKERSIRRNVSMLSSMLKQVQIQRLDDEVSRSDHGEIVPARLWKVGRTEDTKLFDMTRHRDDSAFVVDILLDGSSSQTIRQPQIAVQGYIVSQALSEAGIPHRVHNFCSYWDYTMLHQFRDYDDGPEANTNILQYRAFGENRDGLAIRAVCDSLMERGEENKILIVLSDGRPSSLGSDRPGSRRPARYVGEDAIKDTAFEVRRARYNGIAVMGIFVGMEDALYAEKKIYGKDFAHISNISSFAHVVGRYLRCVMEQDQ